MPLSVSAERSFRFDQLLYLLVLGLLVNGIFLLDGQLSIKHISIQALSTHAKLEPIGSIGSDREFCDRFGCAALPPPELVAHHGMVQSSANERGEANCVK